jgi:hypothetical protein
MVLLVLSVMPDLLIVRRHHRITRGIIAMGDRVRQGRVLRILDALDVFVSLIAKGKFVGYVRRNESV